VQWELYYAK
jgi:hypothetical protein